MSQYIFKDELMKSRLIRKERDWYVGEYKTPDMPSWMPWIAGTAGYLGLTEQEKSWSIGNNP